MRVIYNIVVSFNEHLAVFYFTQVFFFIVFIRLVTVYSLPVVRHRLQSKRFLIFYLFIYYFHTAATNNPSLGLLVNFGCGTTRPGLRVRAHAF